MIVTVTPNTVLDYTLLVPRFELNRTIRASAHAWGMGGKANDAAWILGRLGVPVLALGFAAGSLGERMEGMLQERGVITDFVQAGGETRLSLVIVTEDGAGQSTLSSSSLHVTPDQLAEFEAPYNQALEKATCLVIGGSLPEGVPPEFFKQAITLARLRGIPVIFDSSGPALLAGLHGKPSLVKPNQDELAGLLGFLPKTTDEFIAAARCLQQDHGTNAIFTLGREGALAVLGEKCYRILPLPVPVLSTAGAGDGVLAGMALAYARGEPPENGLRYGFALAGAILRTLGTADFEVEEYRRLLPEITLIPLDDKTS
jgi:1-phosphofructokinase family hexose kinase